MRRPATWCRRTRGCTRGTRFPMAEVRALAGDARHRRFELESEAPLHPDGRRQARARDRERLWAHAYAARRRRVGSATALTGCGHLPGGPPSLARRKRP
jgi:hypothetical protein